MDITTIYKNKYFSILGDSISTFEGISEPKTAVHYNKDLKISAGMPTVLDTWWGRVIDGLGGKLLVNNSWSGSTVCKLPAHETTSYGCSDERTSSLAKDGVLPDVIIVFLGENDWGAGFQVTQSRTLRSSKTDCRVFSIAYRTMIEKIKTNYPLAEIWCMTLPISCWLVKENFQFPYYMRGGHINEYCEAIRDAAKLYNCKLIDLYQNKNPYDTLDGIHPNASGMFTIANAVLEELKKEQE